MKEGKEQNINEEKAVINMDCLDYDCMSSHPFTAICQYLCKYLLYNKFNSAFS